MAARISGAKYTGLNASNARQGIKTDVGGQLCREQQCGLNASNARQGIKTQGVAIAFYPWVLCLNASNARQGIKTYRSGWRTARGGRV